MPTESADFTEDLLERAADEIERLTKLAREQGQEIAITREHDERLVHVLQAIASTDMDARQMRNSAVAVLAATGNLE